MDKQKRLIVVIAAIGVIATFLPWATVKFVGFSINGTNAGDGWITLAIFAVAGALCILGDKTKPLNGLYRVIIMLAGIAAAAVGIYNIVDMRSQLAGIAKDNFFGDQLKDAISTGFGLWLVVICGLALVAVIFLMKEKKIPESVSTETTEE